MLLPVEHVALMLIMLPASTVRCVPILASSIFPLESMSDQDEGSQDNIEGVSPVKFLWTLIIIRWDEIPVDDGRRREF